ncbi:cation:proton antiporter [Novacetimonas hansenii]|uniref:Sodium/hydrogen exchanger family protein n=2 Tax=Novacetimonas hansenii TaxID=436 RepID=A0ABQ0SCM2_NOVHA|nr:cation:proton antiporter [Novacetimonas hansenii]EFG84158.1 Na+/H+ antiporter [Novacetimonas hansenii ATCC 23769]GAN84961.1 Na+/H+ antiporter [Novacetimonas hansenii JCM 7643]GEC62954.1 sodium/hydrogen exchanger family protein [Novacetimonas hansenii]
MDQLLHFFADVLLFVFIPSLLWRWSQKTIPIVVIPILVGIVIAVTKYPVGTWGIPSQYGEDVGWIAVLVLAFTAGLDMWQFSDGVDPNQNFTAPSMGRLLGSALVALGVPFCIGSVLIYFYFLPLHGWETPHGSSTIGAMSIGLCLAVSALPVMIGVVRELSPAERPMGHLALRLAIVDDAALWIGLACLQFAAEGPGAFHGWHITQFIAVAVLGGLALISSTAAYRLPHPPLWVIWAAVPLWLASGAWASMQIGLHELIGAYFAGAIMPPKWVRRLPVERVGTFSLLWLAPMFFGHSGMHINGEALTWPSVIASLLLVVISITTKMGAVVLYPPSPDMSRQQALGMGALLQCKGLMEIVAATILHNKGMISEFAYASLMVLAVTSTTLTGPMFRLVTRWRRPA